MHRTSSVIRLAAVGVVLLALAAPAGAEPDGGVELAAGPDAGVKSGGTYADPAAEPEVMEVYGRRVSSAIDDARPIDTIDRDALDRRQPNSTPDALVLSPGVYVQQTAHGQASPYIRGRTGQQVLILYDGLRLNHALFRKGPNQYLFTVDAASVERIEVVRGSASVELGADALGGAVLLHPLEPRIDPTRDEVILRPRVFAGHRTADEETRRPRRDRRPARRRPRPPARRRRPHGRPPRSRRRRLPRRPRPEPTMRRQPHRALL
jgi:hypothetical protein